MIASIAQGLYLAVAERDHLFRLAGHHPPAAGPSGEHIGPGLLRVLDRLSDTPAEIVTELGETLRQTALGVALTGETAGLTGASRSIGYRWFADPSSRALYAAEDHEFLSRLWVSGLREVMTRRGRPSRAARLADSLLEQSEEFRAIWDLHEVGLRPRESKHFVHPQLGALELACRRRWSTRASHTRCSCTRRRPAPRATRSCSCSR